MSKYKNIVIDGNNLYYAQFFGNKEIKTKVYGKELLTGGIKGFLKYVDKVEKTYLADNGTIYFLWDNPTSKEKLRQQMDERYLDRKELDIDYKISRNKESNAFYRGIDFLRLLLQNRQEKYIDIQVEKVEADDIVNVVVEQLDKYDRTLVISTDMDWSRSIDDNVHWLSGNKIFDMRAFKDKYDFTPIGKNVELYKTIRGDKSDFIPSGIPNLPKDLVLRLVEDFQDIYDLLSGFLNVDYLSKHWKDKIEKKRSRLRLNYQLVSFVNVPEELVIAGTTICGSNKSKFIQTLKLLGFNPSEFVTDMRVTKPKKKVTSSNMFTKSTNIDRLPRK